MDELSLIASARTGQAASFNRLIEAHQDMIYSVAYHLLGQADGAVKATEEAFLTAYRALPAYRGGSFQIWLLRIVIRACHKNLTRRRNNTTIIPKYPEGQGAEMEMAQVIGAGICGLPWKQRVTLVLADVQGLSHEEVAQVTGWAPAEVGRRLAEARGRLRDWLYGSGPGTRCTLRASATCRET